MRKLTLATLVLSLVAAPGATCGGPTKICDELVAKVTKCCAKAVQAADQTACQVVLSNAEDAQSAASAIHQDCMESELAAFTCPYK
jgi:hypothetical protein